MCSHNAVTACRCVRSVQEVHAGHCHVGSGRIWSRRSAEIDSRCNNLFGRRCNLVTNGRELMCSVRPDLRSLRGLRSLRSLRSSSSKVRQKPCARIHHTTLLRGIDLRTAAIRGVNARSIHRHGCGVLLHRCGRIVLLCRGTHSSILVAPHDLCTTVKCPSHASGQSRGSIGDSPLCWIGRSALRSNVHLW